MPIHTAYHEDLADAPLATPEELEVGAGLLLIVATALLASGLGKLLGRGAGRLAWGAFLLLWAKLIYEAWQER